MCEIPIAQLAKFIDGKIDTIQSSEHRPSPHFRVSSAGRNTICLMSPISTGSRRLVMFQRRRRLWFGLQPLRGHRCLRRLRVDFVSNSLRIRGTKGIGRDRSCPLSLFDGSVFPSSFRFIFIWVYVHLGSVSSVVSRSSFLLYLASVTICMAIRQARSQCSTI